MKSFMLDRANAVRQRTPRRVCAVTLLCLASFAAHGAGAGEALTDTEIASQYEAENNRCISMTGEAKDLCQRDAKATRERLRLAQKNAASTPSAGAASSEDIATTPAVFGTPAAPK